MMGDRHSYICMYNRRKKVIRKKVKDRENNTFHTIVDFQNVSFDNLKQQHYKALKPYNDSGHKTVHLFSFLIFCFPKM